MKLSEYKNTSIEYSKDTSDIIRQLAFAGIAVIWIFKNTDATLPMIPSPLILPLTLFAATLVVDLLHYFTGTVVWTSFFIKKEKRLKHIEKDDPEIASSVWLSRPLWVFFYLKFTTIIAGYMFLISFLLGKLT